MARRSSTLFLATTALAASVACGHDGSPARAPARATSGGASATASSAPAALSESASVVTAGNAAPPSGMAARQVIQRAPVGGLGADVAVSRDGMVATFTDDDTLRIWHLPSRTLLRAIPAMALNGGSFSHPVRAQWDESTHEVLLAIDKGFLAIDANGRQKTREWQDSDRLVAVAASPGGAMRWIAGWGNPRLLDAQGKTIAELKAASKLGVDTAVSNDGRFALAAYDKGLARFALDSPTSAPLSIPLPLTPSAKEDSVATKTLAISAHGDDALVCAKTNKGMQLFRVTGIGRAPSVSAVPMAASAVQCNVVFVGASDVAVVATGAELVGVNAKSGAITWRTPTVQTVTAIDASDDGRTIVAVEYDGIVTVYDARAGDVIGELGARVVAPRAVAFQKDDSLVAMTLRPSMFGNLEHVAAWSLKDGARAQSLDVDWGTEWRLADDGALRVARMSGLRGQKPCAAGELDVTFSLGAIGTGAPKVEGAKGVWPPTAARGATTCLAPKQVVMAIDPVNGRIAIESRESGAKPTYAVVDASGALHALSDVPSGGIGGAMLWFSRDARLVFSAPSVRGGWSTLHAWSAASGTKLGLFTADPKDKPGITIGESRKGYYAEAVSDDGAVLAVGGDDSITLYEVASKRALRTVVLPGGAYIASLAFAAGSRARIFAGTADGALFVSDADGAGARALLKGASAGGAIRSIVARQDGTRVATISDDGAMRAWDAKTGEPLASFIEFADGEYIATTPRGAYAGTWEAADRVGWVFDDPAEGFTFQQFAKTFQRGDVVMRRLAGGADLEQGVGRPPRITISTPRPERVTTGSVSFTAHVSSPRSVASLGVFVEGRPVSTTKVGAADADVKLTVPLLPGLDVVSLVAFDDAGASSNVTSFEVTSAPAAGAAAAARPDLWIVSAGVGRYANMGAEQQLDAAVNDARSVAAAFSAQTGAGKPFAAARAAVLIDDEVTPTSLVAAVRGLSSMKPEDVAVVFFAGHGVKLPGTGEMVLATGAAKLNAASVSANGVGWNAMGAALATAKGRVLVMLDACHSGHISQELIVPNSALADDLVKTQRAGIVVFAASKGRELSYEANTSRGLVLDEAQKDLVEAKRDPAPPPPSATANKSVGHGFFTGALLRSLESPTTDANGDGVVQLSELITQVTVRVGRVSSGRQNPWVARRELFGDFVLARATR